MTSRKQTQKTASRPHARDSVRLNDFRLSLEQVIPEAYRKIADRNFDAWTSAGMPLPCETPKIKHEGRWNGLPVFGCYLGLFYRAYCVLARDGVAYWFFIGNHPDAGYIPAPPRNFDPDNRP